MRERAKVFPVNFKASMKYNRLNTKLNDCEFKLTQIAMMNALLSNTSTQRETTNPKNALSLVPLFETNMNYN